jgi:hypothetical protein
MENNKKYLAKSLFLLFIVVSFFVFTNILKINFTKNKTIYRIKYQYYKNIHTAKLNKNIKKLNLLAPYFCLTFVM